MVSCTWPHAVCSAQAPGRPHLWSPSPLAVPGPLVLWRLPGCTLLIASRLACCCPLPGPHGGLQAPGFCEQLWVTLIGWHTPPKWRGPRVSLWEVQEPRVPRSPPDSQPCCPAQARPTTATWHCPEACRSVAGEGIPPGPLTRDPEKLEEKMMRTQRKQGCPKAGMWGPGPWRTLPPAPRPQLRRATASGQAGGLPGLLTWL